MKTNKCLISVVIPTLGCTNLIETIKSLNSGTIVPSEILICIPKEFTDRVSNIKIANVIIISCESKGQVAQRAYGFKHAKYAYVLQLDDDMYLHKHCLEELLACIKETSNISAGPIFKNIKTGQYQSFLLPNNKNSISEKLFYYILNGKNGFQPGKISLSGFNFGYPEQPGTWRDVDWLPGGCILHRKENLVSSNYYPFSGKAYAEDLFHSRILRKKGIKLVRCGSAICKADLSTNITNVKELVYLYFNYAKPMRYFSKLQETGFIRFHLSFFFLIMKNILNNIFARAKNYD